jgi:hypothetical protein
VVEEVSHGFLVPRSQLQNSLLLQRVLRLNGIEDDTGSQEERSSIVLCKTTGRHELNSHVHSRQITPESGRSTSIAVRLEALVGGYVRLKSGNSVGRYFNSVTIPRVLLGLRLDVVRRSLSFPSHLESGLDALVRIVSPQKGDG